MEAITLTWTAATPGSNPLLEYRIFRGVNGGARSFITAIAADQPRTYQDTDVIGDDNTYAYHVIARDTQGNDGAISNIQTLPFFIISEEGLPFEIESGTDRMLTEVP